MRVLLMNTVVVLVLAVCSAAQADEDVDARAESTFREGVEHFNVRRYEEAATAFRKAYELKSNWKLFYNIGQSEAAAKRNGLALEAFEQYLTEGGDDIQEARYEEIRKEVNRLRDVVGSLDIRAPEGASVFVDDMNRGRTPLPGPLMVASGIEHKVVVNLEDEPIINRIVRVSGGKTLVIKGERSSKPSTTPTPAPENEEPVLISEPAENTPDEEEPAKEDSDVKTWGWVTLGVGGALLVGGTIAGGMALSADKDIDGKCPDGCYSQYYDDMDRRDNLALTADILLGVGLAATTSGIVMLIVAASGDEDSEDSAGIFPLVGPQMAGAALEWRF